MRITLFGTTTVEIDGTEHVVTAPRQRSVLARLALAPGAPVSADQLLTDVWGDDLPKGGPKAVAFQITKLRDLLEPNRDGTGRLITTDGAGYRLSISPDDVDIHAFDHAVAEARSNLHDPDHAGGLIDTALGLWRGAPFADVDEQPWVTDQIARLHDLRLLAERTSIQCRMALGDHAGVIADLEQLIRHHPLEEGLVADLMTALHEAARTADALRAFGDLRLRLSEELGIEPSADLADLEQRLLAGMPRTHVEGPDERGNLPVVPTSFVGRGAELDWISSALAASPLAVLTGPGGSGKTRLAVEYARSTSFPDGAWFVELAPVTDPELVTTVIGAVFGLRAGEGASIDEVLRRYLRNKKLLLIVDNCEHVLAAASAAIDDIIRAALDVQIVATSRESLGIGGEQLVSVPPLSLPDGGEPSDAVQLLVDRARQAGVEATDMAAVERICVRLEGMPLAIELAAARLRTLSLAELADRLDESLRALSASAKRAPERHRTLSATVDWSYSLLTPEEQTALQRLSVFPAPFDLAAAEAVVGDVAADQWELLELLDSLVDKSLVVSQTGDAETRYHLLVPVREFAAALLNAADSAATRLRHAEHYAAVAAEAAPHIRGPGYPEWATLLFTELNHLRHAIDTFMEQGRPEAVIEIAADLHVFFVHNGLHVEFIEATLEALAAATDAEPALRIKGWWVASIMSAEITDPRGIDQARAGLAEAQATGDKSLIGRMELALGGAIRHTGLDPEYLEHLVEGRRLLAEQPEPFWWDPTWEHGLTQFIIAAYLPLDDGRRQEHLEAAIEAFEATGDVVLHAAVLGETASLLGFADREWVTANSRRSVEILDRLDIPYWAGHSRIMLGVLLVLRGALDEAMAHFREAADELIDCGDINCWAVATGVTAECEINLGRLDAAAGRLAEVIASIDHLPMVDLHRARTLDRLAYLAHTRDEPELAVMLLAAAMAFPTWETAIPREPLHERLSEELETILGSARFAELTAAGRDLDFASAVAQSQHLLGADGAEP